MTNLKSLKKSIASTESLQSIVTTMKAHASTQIHQFERAAQASVSYRRVLDTALAVLLADEEKKTANNGTVTGQSISSSVLIMD